jgi:adenylate kinase family enzyme
MQKDILFFWVQWCGKWTQANIFLQKNPSYKYFEAWNIFRALSSNKNIFSDYVSSRIQAGLLVEDKLVFWLFDCGTNLLNTWEYMLLDGFPRNLDQKNYFTQQRNDKWRDYVCVNFDLPREKAIERIQKRAIEQWRADDAKEEVINKILETFYSETLPVIQAFESEWKVITINADQWIDEIYNEMYSKLILN